MIPRELIELPQWVHWRYETRDTPHGPKQTKVPYDPKVRDQKARSTDSTTWGTYEDAKRWGAVGFVFSPDDPYVGVDMDACVTPAGRVHPAAQRIVKVLGGYWEFSPSGTGLHVITRGKLERGRHTLKTPWDNELAVYDRGRFFTVMDSGRGEVRPAQAELDALLAHYFPPAERHAVVPSQPVSDDDVELVDRLLADPRTAALWHGETADHGGDHSAADLALCAHLAYFTGNDFGRIDALFRRSGLMRSKWDQRRGDSTYGRTTIERAMGC